ncbi:MAG: hypothetical protein KIT54_10530 [Phycisphaeraceae bacterium]|nr:hypothetical protein [Phycisphaeraceae bacterium]
MNQSSNDRVPRNEATFVAWLAQRVVVWSGGQGGVPDIGLTSSQVASLAGLSATLTTKYQALQTLRNQTAAAKIEKDAALAAAREMLGGDIGIIDGYAKTTGDMGVYARAQIAPPKPATPRNDPAQPGDLRLAATTDGALELSFKATTGGGAVFLVQRQFRAIGAAPGPWLDVATIADKRWEDNDIPTGLAAIRYRVRTKLTNGQLSQWSQDAVFYYGVDGGSGLSFDAHEATDKPGDEGELPGHSTAAA